MKPLSAETSLPVVNPQGSDKEMLDSLLAETFLFFRDEVNPLNRPHA